MAKALCRKTRENNINIKVGLEKRGCTYSPPKTFRNNKGKDSDDYPYIFRSYKDFESFLRKNDEGVQFVEESVDSFYQFYDNYFVELNEDEAEYWRGHDYPNLYRWEFNGRDYSPTRIIDGHSYDFYFYQITEEELQTLMPESQSGAFYEEAKSYLKKYKVEDAKDAVKPIEAEIRHLIDEHKDELMEIHDEASGGGLDCGFVNLYFSKKPHREYKQILAHHTSDAKWIDARVPGGQSVTKKKKVADRIVELVRDELGIEIFYKSRLD